MLRRQCQHSATRSFVLADYLTRVRYISTASADLSVLAIETSCDDSSVAVLTLEGDGIASGASPQLKSTVNFHKTITAQSQQYNGIHPLVALSSHHVALADLVQTAYQHMKNTMPEWKPSLVAATRGPGMRSNLAVGLSVAKGLAVAWNRPLIGVHHMQAHALTPRLCWTLERDEEPSTWAYDAIRPRFPYLTVLASGGHTMLLHSTDLCEHKILAETQDIALGDCLDKVARAVLPVELCTPPYGRALEQFAFPNGASDYNYTAPRSREEELRQHITPWSWSLPTPLKNKAGEKTNRRMAYSYAGLLSHVERLMQRELGSSPTERISETERRDIARELLRVSFEHLASRILLHLSDPASEPIETIVISGGVASNRYLRHVLRQMLDARGFNHISAVFPPIALCTDNALMIAWAALEMYTAGYSTSLDVEPIRKWSMDSGAADGGILGAHGWLS